MSFPRYERGVIETAEALHGSLTGSGDPIDEEAAVAWLRERIFHEWAPPSLPGTNGYDSAVRALAEAALNEYEYRRAREVR